MKTIIVASMILLWVCFIWGQVAYATPQIEFVGETTFDFGTVEANKTLTHLFVFKNTGDRVLNIEQVKGG